MNDWNEMMTGPPKILKFWKASRVYHLRSYQYRTLLNDSMQSKNYH